MNPKYYIEKEAQGNTLYRLQQQCNGNGFRIVQHSDITTQSKVSVAAPKEEVQFLKCICSSKWPKVFETIRINLLRFMMIGDEVNSNQGNAYTVI